MIRLAEWTDERVEILTRAWKSGVSCSQIAKMLGGTTRNAVIGKIHRLGMGSRVTPYRPNKRAQTTKIDSRRENRFGGRIESIRHKPIRTTAPPIAPLNIPLDALNAFTCRAVSDESEWGRATYCGHMTVAGSSWCAGHFSMCFLEAPPKRRRVVQYEQRRGHGQNF